EQALMAAFRKIDQTQHVIAGVAYPGDFHVLAQFHLLTTRQGLEKQIVEQRKSMPSIITTLVLQECKTPRTTHIHLVGDFLRPGQTVKPGTPSVLHPLADTETTNRLDLAKW